MTILTPSELTLTTTRMSLWEALDVWPETADVFATQYRWNEEVSQIGDDLTSISDFPGINIETKSIQPQWWTHRMMQFHCTYTVQIMTQDWSLPEAEKLIERVWNAFYRATRPNETVTIVKAASGYYPSRLGPLAWTFPTNKDGTKFVLTEMTIELTRQKDPFGP
jgi:hypothetical protein